jgi:hypothetical protein
LYDLFLPAKISESMECALAELRRVARLHATDHAEADTLAERALRLAVETAAERPIDLDVASWLISTLRRVMN